MGYKDTSISNIIVQTLFYLILLFLLISIYFILFTISKKNNYFRLLLTIFCLIYILTLNDLKDIIVFFYIIITLVIISLLHTFIYNFILKNKHMNKNIFNNLLINFSNYIILLLVCIITNLAYEYTPILS